MVQFYFLSIACNLFAGYVLFRDRLESAEDAQPWSIDNETFRLFLGIVSIIVSLLKILSSYQGDLPIIGDFLPALAGFISGFALVFEYYRNKSSLESEQSDKLAIFIAEKRKWIGGISIIFGVLHFIFPRVLLL